MVSKVAVIAIVALVAIPVGLGYALNFQDIETTKYENLQTTNVSQFLHNGQRYDYVDANIYDLNGKRFQHHSAVDMMYPNYNAVTSATSSIMLTTVGLSAYLYQFTDSITYYQMITGINTNIADPQVSINLTEASTGQSATYRGVIAVSYDSGGKRGADALNVPLKIIYTNGQAGATYYSIDITATNGINSLSYTTTSAYTGTPYGFYYAPEKTGQYSPNKTTTGASIADGFKLGFGIDRVAQNWITPGSGAEKIIMTLNLATLNGTANIRPYKTNPGNTNLIQITNNGTSATFAGQDIITGDPSNSTYQLIITRTGAELHYIGKWPTQIGLANYYRSWGQTFDNPIPQDEFITRLFFGSPDTVSFGQVRFDYAAIKSAPIPSIVDRTYDPATITGFDTFFTTIKEITYYGPSLSFAGNTYTITKGNLVLNENRSISLSTIKFISEKNAAGTFDNKINDYVISTTATPSTITFNGTWSANVATTNMRVTTSVDNHWVPGEWSWNGLDSNFAIIGLMSCIGVFIGLGIYGQRSGKKVGALMLICAGSAFVFLALLQ